MLSGVADFHNELNFLPVVNTCKAVSRTGHPPYHESSSKSKPVAESTAAKRGSSNGSTNPYCSKEWSDLAVTGEYV